MSEPIHERQVISYLQLRKGVGILGTSLPILLLLGSLVFKICIQDSISDYYYTPLREVFVGILWAVGIFLFSYTGPQRIDNRLGNVTGAFAIGVSLFPTDDPRKILGPLDVGGLHLLFAGSFFILLAVFCLVLFVRSAEGQKPTPEKLRRNRIYRICGWTIVACVAVLILLFTTKFISEAEQERLNTTFWIEAVGLWAFGFSWLVKGGALFKDVQASLNS